VRALKMKESGDGCGRGIMTWIKVERNGKKEVMMGDGRVGKTRVTRRIVR